MRRSVSSPGPARRALQRLGERLASLQRADARAHAARRAISNESVTVPCVPASASRRSTASWRSSSSSKPRSSRSAMPPSDQPDHGLPVAPDGRRQLDPVSRHVAPSGVRHGGRRSSHPITLSPRMRHAVCPGATPWTGSLELELERRRAAGAAARCRAAARRGSAASRASDLGRHRGSRRASASGHLRAWRAPRAARPSRGWCAASLCEHVERLGGRRRRCRGAGRR